MTALLILKILLTIFTLFLIPIYYKNYGLQNFLWLSDIGLFMTVIALWLHSSLIMSMAAIGILPVEIVWIVDYFYRLSTGRKLLGITDYMFDSTLTKFLRSLSLFHLVIPVIWVIAIFNWGYNPSAPVYETILIWSVLSITYFFTDPKENINWVFSPQAFRWQHVSQPLWFAFLLLGFPLLIIWPLHLLLGFKLV